MTPAASTGASSPDAIWPSNGTSDTATTTTT
jgi:hypothetical protein